MSVTVSSHHQVTIPKEVREQLNIKPGQKLQVIVLGGVMHFVPVPSLDDLREIAKDADTSSVRDEGDRY